MNINNDKKQDNKLNNNNKKIDIVLIGGGIMSATLGMFLNILEPTWVIYLYERLDSVAKESTNIWNNAGTGHAAFCELNYTNQTKDGTIDISNAIKINESFEMSRQFWSFLTKQQILKNPKSFINNVPHMSFVWGKENINFLYNRFNALKHSNLFHGMLYTEDPKKIHKWAPLIMEGRNSKQKVAATRMETGTDINFGEITKQILNKLKKTPNFHIYLKHNVKKITRNHNNTWQIKIADNSQNKKEINVNTHYVFIGSGGKALNLLQSSSIPEMYGYAGFPVSGKFLINQNTDTTKHHLAKVYGKAQIKTPPMSVPHIDTRIINGKQILLFGPFANISSKFLKYGSWTDMFYTLKCHNLIPMMQAGIQNINLINYLLKQSIMSQKNRIKNLKEFYPLANEKDWSLIHAGQRVQIIKKNKNKKGNLQFGTEIITSSDGSLSTILGASPGASTSVSIILELLKKIFKKKFSNNTWTKKIKEIIPSYEQQLNNNPILTNEIQKDICNTLELKNINIINKEK